MRLRSILRPLRVQWVFWETRVLSDSQYFGTFDFNKGKNWITSQNSEIFFIPHMLYGLNTTQTFSGEKKCLIGYSAIILSSQLHKNRGTCCTVEWHYCPFSKL